MSAELITRADWMGSLYRQFTTALEIAAQKELHAIQRAAAIGAELLKTRAELAGNYADWFAAAAERIGFGVRHEQRFTAVARIVEKCGGLEALSADGYDAICRELNLKGREPAAIENSQKETKATQAVHQSRPFFSFACRLKCDPAEMPRDQASAL